MNNYGYFFFIDITKKFKFYKDLMFRLAKPTNS